MYNTRDVQFAGKHDFDKENALTFVGWNVTFSVGIFQWQLKSNRKEMKRGKSIVRVKGDVSNKDNVFKRAEEIVKLLDDGKWSGKKSVFVKPLEEK